MKTKGIILADPDDIDTLIRQALKFRALLDETLYLTQVMTVLALEPGIAIQFRDMRLTVAEVIYQARKWKTQLKGKDALLEPVSIEAFHFQLDKLLAQQDILKSLLSEIRAKWDAVKLMKGKNPWTDHRKF